MVGRRRTLAAALGVAAVVAGWLVGIVTAPRHPAPVSVAVVPRPSAVVAGTAAPVPSAPAATAAPTSTPDETVADFYRLVEQHRFDAAVGLWSPRMQASYPPGENVYQRFAGTTSLTLERNEVTQPGDTAAGVAIDLIEVRDGRTYRWVGSWYLVRQSSWLLDQPALRPG